MNMVLPPIAESWLNLTPDSMIHDMKTAIKKSAPEILPVKKPYLNPFV